MHVQTCARARTVRARVRPRTQRRSIKYMQGLNELLAPFFLLVPPAAAGLTNARATFLLFSDIRASPLRPLRFGT